MQQQLASLQVQAPMRTRFSAVKGILCIERMQVYWCRASLNWSQEFFVRTGGTINSNCNLSDSQFDNSQKMEDVVLSREGKTFCTTPRADKFRKIVEYLFCVALFLAVWVTPTGCQLHGILGIAHCTVRAPCGTPGKTGPKIGTTNCTQSNIRNVAIR